MSNKTFRPLEWLCQCGIFVFHSSLQLLPNAWSRKGIFGLSRLILKHSQKARCRAINNIKRAFPDMHETAVEALAYKSYSHICLGVVQILKLRSLELHIHCDSDTLELMRNQQGACVATLHSACYEAVPLAVARVTNNSTTLSNIPSHLAFAHKLYKEANIRCLNKRQNGAFIGLLRAAQEGQNIVLHSDHFAQDVAVRFFNHDTFAPGGIAMLSAMAKKPIVIGYARYDKDYNCHVHFETFSPTACAKKSEAIQETMQNLYRRFEDLICQIREDWYWSYNRWR